ncbi:PREDICTED: uncharacterized protein LOC105147881 isoform X2 [Acromyrmex echinatior]|uniref:uncharacterized protein LOC105147881 isoform X2 n=1 Tax=Acromyrmex echinatior TaxID=103372 RepID=UPI000580B6ED|nr:PREDICTED: uncharacterized protein LOC105147881 isoform X2 [Acromyrmex echinatior]
MFVLSGSQNQKIQKISRILEDEEQLIFHANIHSDNCSSQDQLSEFNKENEALPCFNPSNRSTIRMNHSQEYNKKRKEYRLLKQFSNIVFFLQIQNIYVEYWSHEKI